MDFARAIRRGRLVRRLTQRELAALVGLQRSTICALENGKQQPSMKTLRDLDAAFRQPLESFLEKAS